MIYNELLNMHNVDCITYKACYMFLKLIESIFMKCY